MLFATYQSNEVVQKLNEEGRYESTWKSEYASSDVLRNLLGYSPIFAIPFEDLQQFLTMTLIQFPAMTNNLIVFESDNYRVLDTVVWNEVMKHPKTDNPERIFNTNEHISEYVMPEISNVRAIIHFNDLVYGDESADDFYQRIFTTYFVKIKRLAKELGLSNVALRAVDIASLHPSEGSRLRYYMDRLVLTPKEITAEECKNYVDYLKSNIFITRS